MSPDIRIIIRRIIIQIPIERTTFQGIIPITTEFSDVRTRIPLSVIDFNLIMDLPPTEDYSSDFSIVTLSSSILILICGGCHLPSEVSSTSFGFIVISISIFYFLRGKTTMLVGTSSEPRYQNYNQTHHNSNTNRTHHTSRHDTEHHRI